MGTIDEISRDLETEFGDAINSHGYGFQAAVIKKCRDLHNAGRSQWSFQVMELPVAHKDTRIDLVLQYDKTFLVGECKRANPEMKSWCFAKTPFMRTYSQNDIFIERLLVHLTNEMDETGYQKNEPMIEAMKWGYSKDIYGIAIEGKVEPVRSKGKDAKACGTGQSNQKKRKWNNETIESAATQVSSALTGLSLFLTRNRSLAGGWHGLHGLFLPVIFTTAELYVSDVDLASADIQTGNVQAIKLNKVPWLWFDYPVSVGMQTGLPRMRTGTRADTLGGILETEYLRTIAVVNADGIEKFLETAANTTRSLNLT
jgi:hypothetical protein